MFDSWRILMSARSMGESGVDQEALRVAASRDRAITQIAEDLFTWPGGRYDIRRGQT